MDAALAWLEIPWSSGSYLDTKEIEKRETKEEKEEKSLHSFTGILKAPAGETVFDQLSHRIECDGLSVVVSEL